MADFFRSPQLIWWILIPAALFLNFMTWHDPRWLGQFGAPGKFLEMLGRRFPKLFTVTNQLALILHVGEALYALKLCSSLAISTDNTIKWALQTLLLGYPSLMILLEQYHPHVHVR